MNVRDLPDLHTETFNNVYAAVVRRVDALTKTVDVTLVFEDQIVEADEGTKMFTFLTDVDLEKVLFNE